MRRVLLLIATASLAGCGANYTPEGNLPRLNRGVCAPCSADADCGPGAYCAAEGNDPPEFCTAPCDANGGCPDGQTCNDFGNGMSGCYPSSNTCQNVVVDPGTGNGAGDGTTSGGTTTTDGTTTGSTSGTTAAASTSSGSTSGSTGTTGTHSSSSTGTTGTHSSSSSGSTTATGGTSGTTGNTCTTDSWATTMHSFFNQNCNGCHGFTSVSAVRSEASSIKSRISSGSMPQGRSLTLDQKNAVIAWINCGEP